jgi:hypothetical protein
VYGGTGETPECQSVVFDFGEYVLTADGGPAFKYMYKAPGDIRNDATKFPNWRNYSASKAARCTMHDRVGGSDSVRIM